MLDKNINIDLHIHTKASVYKEEKGLVDNSTFENINILLDKLDNDEHKISMFSFTDHNRFDPDIYIRTRELINKKNYEYVKTLLAGVEFDVLLEEGKEPCHIITIFNDKKEEDLHKIKSVLEESLLISKDLYYSKYQFEEILRKIGLESLLIVCQRKDLNRTDGGHRSLSDSTSKPFEYLKYGYFDALEFQKPGVEGILLSNLSPLDIDTSLVLGSDCHDWSVYPKHDKLSLEKKYSSSSIRSLPTFKGLLLALTSPRTRFKRRQDVKKVIDYLSVNDKVFPLSSGLNAIIGENGSGKTLLLSVLQEKFPKYYKNIIDTNNIHYNATIDLANTLKINQGEITKNSYESNSIFGNDVNYFKNIDNTIFVEKTNAFSKDLLKKIKSTIIKEELYEKLENIKYLHNPDLEKETTFYITIHKIENFEVVSNPHEDRAVNLKSILDQLNGEIINNYYDKEISEKLIEVKEKLLVVYDMVQNKNIKIKKEIRVKNAIINKIDDYITKITPNTTELASNISNYKSDKSNLKYSVLNYINADIQNKNKIISAFPNNINGKSSNLIKGFEFSRISQYHQNDLEQLFYEKMFVKDYQSIDQLMSIKKYNELIKAIDGVTKKEQIDIGWNSNIQKFINEAVKYQEKIFEVKNGSEIGNTMGEMSLVYYKFRLHNYSEWDLMIIDQPEDNISAFNINTHLIELLNNIRDKKQVIFVTHNPLLVVNLDVDNVIYVEKEGTEINIVSGCLENEENKILEIVSDKMDGGLETIEKRLKYYGKKY